MDFHWKWHNQPRCVFMVLFLPSWPMYDYSLTFQPLFWNSWNLCVYTQCSCYYGLNRSVNQNTELGHWHFSQYIQSIDMFKIDRTPSGHCWQAVCCILSHLSHSIGTRFLLQNLMLKSAVVPFQKMDYFCATAVILYSIYLCCVRSAHAHLFYK